MASLSDGQKRFLVRELACFESPKQVQASFREFYKQTLDIRQISNYDGGKEWARGRMAASLRLYFDRCRTAFLKDTETIGISHKPFRLRALQRYAEQMEGMNNYVGAASMHEQAAKEMGGAYTNRREVTGADGAPLSPLPNLDGLTTRQLEALLKDASDAEPVPPPEA